MKSNTSKRPIKNEKRDRKNVDVKLRILNRKLQRRVK